MYIFGRTYTCIPCYRASRRVENMTKEKIEKRNARQRTENLSEEQRENRNAKMRVENMTDDKIQKQRDRAHRRKENMTEEQLEKLRNYLRSYHRNMTGKQLEKKRDRDRIRARVGNMTEEQLEKKRKRDRIRYRVENMTEEQLEKARARDRIRHHERRGWSVPSNFHLADFCEYCEVSNTKMTIDHIVPAKYKDFVPNKSKLDIRFFATACESCNFSKHTKLPNSQKHLDQVSEVLGYDIRKADWIPDFWQPPLIRH